MNGHIVKLSKANVNYALPGETDMDKYQSEIFGEFTYAQSLTYEELLASENTLLENLEEILRDASAEHLDFTPLGDILMMQCVFTVQNLEILRDVAGEVAAVLPRGVRGRFLCLEKNLASYHTFWIMQGAWCEKHYTLPKAPPAEASVNEVELTLEDVDMETTAAEEAENMDN